MRLLNSSLTRFISRITEEAALLQWVLLLVVLIFLVVTSIYLYLSFKKRKFRYLARISRVVENILTPIITEENAGACVVPQKLHEILNNRVARQFALDELIRCKKNFSGTLGEVVVSLYIQLGLKSVSLAKLKPRKSWHIKARGIQELYLMAQQDQLSALYKFADDSNEFVRMEAQTGVIHLTGFAGLRFLDMISYPLTEWQQLKLLEQLRLYPGKTDFAADLSRWLQLDNPTVVCFALRLAEEYQQFGITTEIRSCLVHPDERVRRQAIRTLAQLADEKTASVLCGHFTKEPVKNQEAILDALKEIATEEQSAFLRQQLDHPESLIKLKAAALLVRSDAEGLRFIEQKASIQPEPYQRIYNAVKDMP